MDAYVCKHCMTLHVSGYMLDVLHWLPFQQRITFRIAAQVWRCLLGLAPPTCEIFDVPPRPSDKKYVYTILFASYRFQLKALFDTIIC